MPIPRDAIIAELRAQLADTIKISREVAEKADEVIDLQRRTDIEELALQATTLRVEALERDNRVRREINSVYASSVETQGNVLAALMSAKKAHQRSVGDAIVPSISSLAERMASLSEAVEHMLEGGIPGPLMSEAIEWWHHDIRVPQGIPDKKTDIDYNRLKDFMAFAGDKPVNRYRFADFQQFASLLASVPANYMKYPAFKACHRRKVLTITRHCRPRSRWMAFRSAR